MNNKYYCKIDNHTITQSMVLLPTHLHHLTTEQLAHMGWYEYQQHVPHHDPRTHKLGSSVFDITDHVVTETWWIQPLTDIELASAKKIWHAKNIQLRNQKLLHTDWLVIRHRDQTDSGGVTTLSASEYQALLTYRQQLRDMPQTQADHQPDWSWPSPPLFMTHTPSS